MVLRRSIRLQVLRQHDRCDDAAPCSSLATLSIARLPRYQPRSDQPTCGRRGEVSQVTQPLCSQADTVAGHRTAMPEPARHRTWDTSWRSKATPLRGARGIRSQGKRSNLQGRRPWSHPCAQVLCPRLGLRPRPCHHLHLFPQSHLLNCRPLRDAHLSVVTCPHEAELTSRELVAYKDRAAIAHCPPTGQQCAPRRLARSGPTCGRHTSSSRL